MRVFEKYPLLDPVTYLSIELKDAYSNLKSIKGLTGKNLSFQKEFKRVRIKITSHILKE